MNGPAGFRIFTPLSNIARATTTGLYVLDKEIQSGGGGGGAGFQGPQGRIGLQGPAGSGGGGGGTQGPIGQQGLQGPIGRQGIQGSFSGVMTADITVASPNLSFGTPTAALGSMYVNNLAGNQGSTDGNPNKAIYVASNILPAENNKYDIGSISLRWKTGYFGANTLYVGDVLISQGGGGTGSTSLLNVQNATQSVQLVNTSAANNKIPQSLLPFSSFVYGFAISYVNNESQSQRTNYANQIYSIINEFNPNYNGLDGTPSFPVGSTALNFDLYSSALSGVYYIIQFSGPNAATSTVTLNMPVITFPSVDNGITFTFSNIGQGTPNNQVFKLGDIALFGMAVNAAGTAVTCTFNRVLFEVPTGSIGSDKIADLAVTHPKIAFEAVQTPNLLDGAVTFDKLNDDVVAYIDEQTSNARVNADPIAFGIGAGETGQGIHAVAIGYQAGNYAQGPYAIAIGFQAGATAQSPNSIVLNASGAGLNGSTAGFFVDPIRYQQGVSTVAVMGIQGFQGPGNGGGGGSFQINPISIGIDAGKTNQGNQGIAIGYEAGNFQQGDYAIAIGFQAGLTGQAPHSIVMNASGARLNAGATGLYIRPVRFFEGQPVQYGLLGVQGFQGMQGIQGVLGLQGFRGIQGFQGAQGFLGPQGGVAGVSTQLQFNQGNSFSASNNLVYDPAQNAFTFGRGQTGGHFTIVGNLVQGITGTTNPYNSAIFGYHSKGRHIEMAADSVNNAYIDFHSNDNSEVDYDTRILSSGGTTGIVGTGNLQFFAQNYVMNTSSDNSNPTITIGPNLIYGSGNILPTNFPPRTRGLYEYRMSGQVNANTSTPTFLIPTSANNARAIWQIEASITNGTGSWNYYSGYAFQNNNANNIIYIPATTAGSSPVIVFANSGASPTIAFNNNTASLANYMLYILTS